MGWCPSVSLALIVCLFKIHHHIYSRKYDISNLTKCTELTFSTENSTSSSGQILLTNPQKAVLVVLYSITIIFSLAGNLLLIYIVTRRPEARKLTSFLFVNMAAADLLVTLIVMPVTIAMPYNGGRWLTGTMGHITCKVVYFSFHVTIEASILSLTLMAVDRFLAVVFPLHRFPSFRRPKVLTFVIWLSSIIVMIPVAVLWRIEEGKPEGMYCQPAFKKMFGDFNKGKTGFYTYLFLISYLVPLFVISILYGLVSCKLCHQTFPGEDLISKGVDKKRHKATKKIVRTLAIVTAAFALCWLPAQSYHLILAFNVNLHYSTPQYVMYLCLWCGHANSAVNAWLYMLLTNNFRKSLRYVMSKGKSTFFERETYV